MRWWSLPWPCLTALLLLLTPAVRAAESPMFAEIGQSYFELFSPETSPDQFLHDDPPPDDFRFDLGQSLQIPEVPQLPVLAEGATEVEEADLPAKGDAPAEVATASFDSAVALNPPVNILRPAKADAEAEAAAEVPAEEEPLPPPEEDAEEPPNDSDEADSAEEEAPAEPSEPAKEEVVETPEAEPAEEPEEPEEPEISYGFLDYVPYGKYYHMDYWLGEATWSKSVELGLNGQTGNTESTSLRVGAKLRRDGKHTIFTSDLRHLRTSNREQLTQNNAHFNHKLEFPLKIYEKWSLFENTNLEYDAFKAFDMRLVFNSGLSYKPIKNEKTELTLSAGAGFSREFGIFEAEAVPEGTLGSSLAHKFTDRQSIDVKFDFYPAFQEEKGYRHVTDASYKISLDHGLSLKMSAINRHDSTPNGREPNDLDYAVLLLFQF